MTYEDIEKANKTIQTTDIKGKQYAEVNQRLKAFRMVYPEGFVISNMISNENGLCIFRAEVGYYSQKYTIAEDVNGKMYQDSYMEKIILATGTAYEKEDSTFINRTSYIENCETSAVGRALGMCGFGIDTSIRSAEEMQNAEVQQIAESKIDDTKIEAMTNYIKKEKLEEKRVLGILAKYGYNNVTEIKVKDYVKIGKELEALTKEN